MERSDLLKLKKYIGQVSRKDTYRVIMFLYRQSSPSAPYSVSEILNKLGMRQTEVSHALTIARSMGLVEYNQVGKFRYYWANRKAIDRHNRQVSNVLSKYK